MDLVRSLRPSDTYMHWWTMTSLVQILAGCLFGAKPLFKPVLAYFFADPLETNFSDIPIKMQQFSYQKINSQISAKWMPFCLSLNVLIYIEISAYLRIMINFNSLWPSDAIWPHRSGWTLAQVMACCLTAPSHYLSQCWLIISKVLWLSCEGNFTRDALIINH